MKYSILDDNRRKYLRKKFINEYINVESEHYKKCIAIMKRYSDGICYSGYLWDSLKEPYNQCIVTQEMATKYLRDKDDCYVMWDIHSDEQIPFNKNVLLMNPKDTAINIKPNVLCKLIEYEWNNWNLKTRYFPEDIYIFDDSMQWCTIFTHEGYDKSIKPELSDSDYIRICFVIEQTF